MLFDCIIEAKLLRMLKDLFPIRDIFISRAIRLEG